jgi:hypothetical protein
MDVNSPYEFLWFGVMDGILPYGFLGFGVIHVNFQHICLRLGASWITICPMSC